MAPELEAFREEFDAISADADALLAALSDTQFYWSPDPGTWSVAQCLEHLNVTARSYLTMLDDSIASAKRWGVYGTGPFRYRWFGRYFVKSMEPPVRRRFKAPVIFQPAPQSAPQRKRTEIEAGFRGYQVQFVDRLAPGQRSGSGQGARAVTRQPLDPSRLGAGFALMTAHERRHLWQARRLAERPDFPRA